MNRFTTILGIALIGLAGCAPASPTPLPAALVEGEPYAPQIDAASFTNGITNPYLPWTPGSRWVYEGSAGADGEVTTVEVLTETRVVMGVTCVVVRDEVTQDGERVELTFDWYAQDAAGNVWYFGEDSAEYENGEVKSRAGSWEAGVDGAQPGIVMPAQPVQLDAVYRQEFYAGEAEDMAKVVLLDQTREVPLGSYSEVLVTEDFTPLEPDVVARKSYAPGIGLIYEKYISGGDEVSSLIEFTAAP